MKATRVRFDQSNSWIVSPVQDASDFFRALAELVPADSFLYIEAGGKPPEEIDAFLRARQIDARIVIDGGTLLPTPLIYTVPATKENLDGLADVQRKYPTPCGSIHVHVYRGQDVLVLSYDSFLDPFWISGQIPETNVKRFSNRLGLQYKRVLK